MSTHFSMNVVPVPSKTSVSRVIAGSAILLDAADDSIHRLNSVGTFLWQRITQRTDTVDQLITAVVGEFDVDEAQAREDVYGFLADLESRRFISLNEGK